MSSESAPNQREASSSIPSGERRQVTVLFADLAGFTRLTSALGAEEIHALLNRYFEAVDAVVESYGGVVDKHIGDNVMAVRPGREAVLRLLTMNQFCPMGSASALSRGVHSDICPEIRRNFDCISG